MTISDMKAIRLFVLLSSITNLAAANPKTKLPPLSEEGVKLEASYASMLEALRQRIRPGIPVIDPQSASAFLAVHDAERGKVTSKPGDKKETRKGGDYKDAKASLASMEAAKPVLAGLETYLKSASLDAEMMKCVVLADATPRGLAVFAQQGAAQKQLIDNLLADPVLMREMLLSGGAKAGRYGRSMEILRDIKAASSRAGEGLFRRIALAISLELAAPELCGYDSIDPVKRYKFYEQSYLEKQLDHHFADHSVWLLRHVVNDPNSEDDMAWMREMLSNYRPDHITAPEGYRARYVGLMNSEFGHIKPEWDEDSGITMIQQTIDKGGLCGPKANFGRCLGRSFGVPVWGARLRSHTAMGYWTPKGWTTILGVAWVNGFWSVDAEPKCGPLFLLEAKAREHPEEFLPCLRARWTGIMLGEEKIDGMKSGTGGLWHALSLNRMRDNVCRVSKPASKDLAPWMADSYLKEDPELPEKMMQAPGFSAEERAIATGADGTVTIPAVACVSPQANTSKIVFMKSRDGRPQLHYKRYELPEPLTYELTVPKAGTYLLEAEVVTVNQHLFFHVTPNGAAKPAEMKLPYTVGKWEKSDPLEITLVAGKNTLMLNRTAPEDFKEKGWSRRGPEYGGITLRSLTLKPAP